VGGVAGKTAGQTRDCSQKLVSLPKIYGQRFDARALDPTVIYPVRTPFGLGGESPLAASIFHFGTYTVGDVKQFLQEQNIPVRL
jgi:hypothetical protein